MATYLELVNRARQEGGASGAALSSLGGVLSQESQRFKNWIDDAWRRLQIEFHDWQFMRADFTLPLVAATQEYDFTDASLTSFRRWKQDSFRIYLTASGVGAESWLTYLPWEDFRDRYLFGAQRAVQGAPVHFTVKPDKTLAFGPVPDDAYTVLGEYYKAPSTLVADGDEPTIAEEHHMLLVWYALRDYALYESAPEVLTRANAEIKRERQWLESDQLPVALSGPPLA